MKIKLNDPPRVFRVGFGEPIELKDCAHVHLAPDEQITFITQGGSEYDVVRKSWGYYATPSLNGRLKQFGLRAVLVKSDHTGKYNIFLLEKGKDPEFYRYLELQGHRVIAWMDDTEALKTLEDKVST
jgi:hypothetical protein